MEGLKLEYIKIQELKKKDENNGSVRVIYFENENKKALNINISEGVYIFNQYDLAFKNRVKLLKYIKKMWKMHR